MAKIYIGDDDTIKELSDNWPALVILSMMGLAILMCLCSEADAFVAASFTKMHPAAKLSFLVLGPDVRLEASDDVHARVSTSSHRSDCVFGRRPGLRLLHDSSRHLGTDGLAGRHGRRIGANAAVRGCSIREGGIVVAHSHAHSHQEEQNTYFLDQLCHRCRLRTAGVYRRDGLPVGNARPYSAQTRVPHTGIGRRHRFIGHGRVSSDRDLATGRPSSANGHGRRNRRRAYTQGRRKLRAWS